MDEDDRARDRTSTRRRRRPRRSAAANTGAGARTHRYRRIERPFRPLEALSEEQLDTVHNNSLQVIEELGIRVLLPEARDIFRAAGGSVDDASGMVRLDRALVLESVARAPTSIVAHGRGASRDVAIGGAMTAFAAAGGCPNSTDLRGGRRPGTLSDLQDFIRLSQTFDVIHMLGQCTEATDVDTSVRHLDVTHAQLTLSDKVPTVYARGRGQVADAFEMLRMAHGLDADSFTRRVVCHTVVNTNSPRQLDVPMALGIIDFARAGQLMVLTPFTLAGAMAPVSLAGALTLQNAEALFGITLSQLVRPGAPVAYGGFTSNVDMRSGAPAFGTPEYTKAAIASGQLARRYGVPWRSSNTNASNAADAQGAYESQMSLWGAMMGGANIVKHAAGWLEGGLVCSFEKFVIDVEMLQMMAEACQPIVVDDAELALDALTEVVPGGHFFGAAHTMDRYADAFYSPLVSDWRNHGAWQEAGAPDAAQRAHTVYRRRLAEFEPPHMDEDIREALDDFVARRRREGGAAPT